MQRETARTNQSHSCHRSIQRTKANASRAYSSNYLVRPQPPPSFFKGVAAGRGDDVPSDRSVGTLLRISDNLTMRLSSRMSRDWEKSLRRWKNSMYWFVDKLTKKERAKRVYYAFTYPNTRCNPIKIRKTLNRYNSEDNDFLSMDKRWLEARNPPL